MLHGLDSKIDEMAPVVVPQGLDHEDSYSEVIVLDFFLPGSILVFQTQLQEHHPDLDAFYTAGVSEPFRVSDLVDSTLSFIMWMGKNVMRVMQLQTRGAS